MARVTAGHVTAGHATAGHVTAGYVTAGHVTAGHATAGHATAGEGDERRPDDAGGRGTPDPVRVLIVDDDAMVRQGLQMMLSAFDEIEVVGAVSDGTEVAGAVDRLRPRVVLMDIRMPGRDGLTATEEVRRRPDPPEVLVLTTFDTDEHVRRAMRVGACGFLLKHEPPAGLARAICRAAAGEPMFTSSVLRQVMGLAAGDAEDPGRGRARAVLERLTPSERNVAELIADGLSNQEIAAELLLSTATVKAYISRIFTKVDLSNRVQVAILVLQAR